jgi:RNA polymerase sigma-70 factor (ECF subfamily)
LTKALGPRAHAAPDEALIRNHRQPLILYFARRGIASSTCEDLAHETFTRLFALTEKDHIDSVEAYLFKIAASVFADHLRRSRVRHEGRHIPLDEAAPAAVVLNPQRVLEGNEAIESVVAVLAVLKPKTREIFLLFRLVGLSYTKIAVRFSV